MLASDTKIVPTGDRFDIDADNSSRLSLRVRGGTYLDGSTGFKSAPNVTLTLTASVANYVEMDDFGVISTNTTGFTAGRTWLYIVTCNANADGSQVALQGNVGVIGSLEVLHRVDQSAAANADLDVVLTHKTRILDAWVILRGAGVASSVITVKNGASAITNAMAASGSDQALVRAATIDDAAYEIAAGGTLRVSNSGGVSQPAATTYIRGVRVV
jgi:hypothetical protein